MKGGEKTKQNKKPTIYYTRRYFMIINTFIMCCIGMASLMCTTLRLSWERQGYKQQQQQQQKEGEDSNRIE